MSEIEGVKTFEFTKIIGLENIEFGSNIIIDDFVFIYACDEHCIGSYVHIASFSSITGGGKFYLGDFTALSSGCRVITGSDDFSGGGLTNSTIPNKFRSVNRGTVTIGKHAIIGANSVILPDVNIGEGCAVGAGSIVTKDLEPWGVYVGNRRVKERRRDIILDYEEKLFKKMELTELS
ncbi:MAG: acyltransferase [Spirochaetes bacterium]|nr:acyltransferase [Spirochaetota bacterium]